MLDETNEIHRLFHNAPTTTEFKKLRRRIVRQTREAIEAYGMVERDAKWLVCLSGGKDSYTLLAVLHELKWRGLLPVELLACNLDQGQPGFPATVLPEFLEKMGVKHRIEYQDTYSIVTAKVPLSEMFGYSTDLRSSSQGRATFTMEYHHYAPVPAHIAEGLVSK